MQKITPHLWFDTQAVEAAHFYVAAFGQDSKITYQSQLHNTPSGDVDIVSFVLLGQEFQAISAGPLFKPNPAISFFVNFDPSRDSEASKHLDALWEKLSLGGKVLMPLQQYPFSEHYGWVQDKYGISWQLILTNPSGEERPWIVPSLLFTQEMAGKAEEAIDLYISVFQHARRGNTARYPAGMEPDKEGTLMYADFMLENQWFAAMDSAQKHDFKFNEALSLLVRCESQEEIDHLWEKLSAYPEAEQCGWLKDAYGVSWQISSVRMDEMMTQGTPEQVARVTEAFLKMKKFDIATLEKAYRGE